MVLVDYSESDPSDSEPAAPPKPAARAPKKQPFQKLVDASNRSKILVPLAPQPVPDEAAAPPAKRARTDPAASRFAGFNALLPPPKKASAAAAAARPGVGLKTSAEPGFERAAINHDAGPRGDDASPHAAAKSAPAHEQKPADEVKLVGKPLMFRPLSVTRTKKKKTKAESTPALPGRATAQAQTSSTAPPPPKKTFLFSVHVDDAPESSQTGAYEPLFEAEPRPGPADQDFAHYASATQHGAPLAPSVDPNSLDAIADDLQLSAAARRELFGRDGGARAAKQVINFNTDQEYQHNEALRAAGEEQVHQPVRALQGGKHSLRQLVQNVSSQREALEDSFAKGRNNRKEASGRYGW